MWAWDVVVVRIVRRTDAITYMNILHALAISKHCLSRKYWAVVIVWCFACYFAVYLFVTASKNRGTCDTCHVESSTWWEQYGIPDMCLSEFFILREMTYQRMMTIQLLKDLNEILSSHRWVEFMQGPLERESRNMMLARGLYKMSKDGGNGLSFVLLFSKLNRYSMLAHLIGMHHNHFQEDKSITHKSMFLLQMNRSGTIGHGGRILRNHFIFALFKL